MSLRVGIKDRIFIYHSFSSFTPFDVSLKENNEVYPHIMNKILYQVQLLFYCWYLRKIKEENFIKTK